jgi:hypothetical protein
MSSPEEEGITIPIQLSLTKADAGFHTLPGPDKVNNPNLRDDSTDGFLIQASLDKVIHGEGSDLATFIGFEFRFEGIDDRRRFRYVKVTIRFEDVGSPGINDPEVVDLWPNQHHVWNQTPVGQENESGGEVEARGGPS